MSESWRRGLRLLFGLGACAVVVAGVACNLQVPGSDGSSGGDGNVLLSDTLSFDGTLSGKVGDSQSTRGSVTDSSTSQGVPLEFDTDNTWVRFRDLAGNELMGADGQPIGEVPINSDGSFTASNLPVGVDFTFCADIGKNGDCEIESCTNIPAEEGGTRGALDDAEADPLTTLVLAKLQDLMMEKGVDLNDLPISPVAVVTRIVDAYRHLFEESGIDQSLVLDDIEGAAGARLAALFETLIPAGARAGMDLVDGNLDLARANDVNAKALSIAKVFLRAGFPIADGPPQPDLSALGDLEGVDTIPASEFFAQGDKFTEEFVEFDEGIGDVLDLAVAQHEGPGDVLIYVNQNAEPDRNFANAEGEFKQDDEGPPPSPILNDYLLLKMAELQNQNRRISLGALYDLLTSLDEGLGLRLTYFIFDPNFHGPPLNVFETADGQGKAINLERMFRRLFAEGFEELTPEEFDRQEVELRALMRDLLAGTVPPQLPRLFKAILRDHIGSVGEFAQAIREARVHLPFSLSGPSEFFVVADGDVFRGDMGVSPITVDADVTLDGDVLALEYNPSGTGTFWLGFGPHTEEDGEVELIVRETGHFLHGRRGPVGVSMNNESFFAPINGAPFIEFVSETGSFYPGINVTVYRNDFVPEAFFPPPDEFFEPFDDGFEDFVDPFDPGFEDPIIIEDEPFDDPLLDEILLLGGEELPPPPPVEEPPLQEVPFDGGPNEQVFVLATGIGPNAEPVRVDYDRASGITTFNPGGRHLLMFLPDSDQTGVFALFNEETGRPASAGDPGDFFAGPSDAPDRFEDFFNNFDDFGEFDEFTEFDELGGLVDGFLEDIPPDDLFFFEDEFPLLPDDEFFFEDEFFDEFGNPILPPDGMEPPPPDTSEPPPVEPAEFDEVTGEPLPEDVFFELFTDEEFLEFEQGPVDFGGGFEILVSVDSLRGIPLELTSFTHVYGTDVPNERYNPAGDPFYDDINGNGEHDAGEPTAQFRPLLFDANDWRSTDLRFYYRRADNDGSVSFDQIDFESVTPRTIDGVALVARNYLPRLNAFRFSRPNTAINLLTAFLPPAFFNGTATLTRETKVDILTAVAMINLIMDQIFNVEAEIDVDGLGPLPPRTLVTDAHLFVMPIGDPFVLLLDGFSARSERVSVP